MAPIFAPIMMVADTGYQISRSLRCRAVLTDYLTRTPAGAGTLTKWSFATWIKRGTLSTAQTIFHGNDTTAATFEGAKFNFNTSEQLVFQCLDAGASKVSVTTNAAYRDTAAWMHVLLVYDSTQGTAANRVKIYVNGLDTSCLHTTDPALNGTTQINTATIHHIARDVTTNTGAREYCDLYLADVYFTDNVALTPTDLGAFDSNGIWQPKAYTGSYGTNGFHLEFADNSGTTATTLGKDTSGNGNNWTPNNFSVTAGLNNDSMVDSPTEYGADTGLGGEVRGNYGTFDPLQTWAAMPTTNSGNLNFQTTANTQVAVGNFGMSSGKWYWELVCSAGIGGIPEWGIANGPLGTISTNGPGQSASAWIYANNAQKGNNNSFSAYGATYTTNDIIGVAFDADAGTLSFYKNGVSQGTAYTGLTNGPYFPIAGVGTSTACTAHLNSGQRAFGSAAPSGYKALCTANMADSAIMKGSQYHNALLYVGNNAARSITGMGHQPDMLWIKDRTVGNHHRLTDILRSGVNTRLLPSSPVVEFADADHTNDWISSFDADGFSFGGATSGANGTNAVSSNLVAYGWKEGATPGVDIITHSGTGVNKTVAHNLGVAPALIISKARNAAVDWIAYHKNMNATPQNGFMLFNTNQLYSTSALIWNNTAPDASNISVGTGTGVNAAGSNYVVYAFAEVPGFSRFNVYTGNNSTNGPFNWCGFRPRFLIIKRVDVANDWFMLDTARSEYNPTDHYVLVSNAAVEATNDLFVDLLSNGFKIRVSGTFAGINASGGTYVWMAWAENPFKIARAR